jgi:hypothetical protein
VRSSFVWKSFRKRSATLQSFPVDTIQADQINSKHEFCPMESNQESNNKSNNTHDPFSIQSFIEIPSYHPTNETLQTTMFGTPGIHFIVHAGVHSFKWSSLPFTLHLLTSMVTSTQ